MMKRIIYVLIAVFTLVACSEDTTEYIQQRDEIDQANQAKQSEIDQQKRELEEKKKQAEIKIFTLKKANFKWWLLLLI